MRYIRVIPRLDIKGSNLVKGIHLEGLRVLGKPLRYAKHYYENGADELLYIDVVASLFGRNCLLELIEKTVKDIFIPLTVGGGLRTIEDIQAVLRAGADKVAINTAAIRNPSFIKEAVQKFGSSTIVVSIEAIKKNDGRYEAYTDNGREKTGIDAVEWAIQAAELGAGELLLTAIDKEGTGEGFDLSLTKSITQTVSIPLIAGGGAGKLEHIRHVIDEGNADAVAIASMFHYDLIDRASVVDDLNEGDDFNFLNNNKQYSKVAKVSIPTVKDFLAKNNIPCRHEP